MNYDTLAETYAEFGTVASTEWKFGYEEEIALLEPLPGLKLLDYGCGDGKVARFFAQRGAHVTGVDVSAEMIAKARAQELEDAAYCVIEPNQPLPFAPHAFDAIVVNFVLCTMASKKEMRTILTALKDVLKPTGKLLVLNANWEEANGKRFASCELVHIENPKSGDAVDVILKGKTSIHVTDYYWTADDYRQVLEKSGFAVKRILTPKANAEDDRWMDERTCAPFVLIEVVKSLI